MTTEQQTIDRLRATLYPNGQEKARESKTPRRKVKLVLKGKAMNCARCGRLFECGEFRVYYAVGWLCRFCYDLLALAPLSARCIVCKQKITIDDWRYKLQSVTTDGDGGFKRYFVHSDCERTLRRPLTKAA